MKRVLFVVHTLQVGGAERILLNLLKYLNKEKYEITVLALVNDGIYIEKLKKIDKIKYKYVFDSFFKKTRKNPKAKFHKTCKILMNFIWKIYLLLIKYFPKTLYKKTVKEKYDVEIAFLEGKVSKFVANSTNECSEKIAWIHTDINNVYGMNIFNNIKDEINCYKKFNKIVCVSEEVKQRFMNKTGIKENLYVQINPICTKEILEKSKEPITKELNHNGRIISSVGRLVPAKGYDRLLEVHNRLIKEGLVHTIWIIGEGVEREKLEEYIKINHLEETVNLVGYTKNPYKYVKNSDIFVCSSRVEGLSSAVLEATVLEKIILSTNCPGTKEILGENGQAAMIVENETEALYNGLKTLLTEPKLRDKFSNNIKERSKLFDINNVIAQIEKIIEE